MNAIIEPLQFIKIYIPGDEPWPSVVDYISN